MISTVSRFMMVSDLKQAQYPLVNLILILCSNKRFVIET